MNKFLRRLMQLEDQAFPATPRRATAAALSESIRQKLGLPLPAAATPAEREEGLRLFRQAIEQLRRDRTDQSGFAALSAFVAELHGNYPSDPDVAADS